jgi:acid stress chaperone HdeB
MVRFKPDTNRHGRPSARHSPIVDHRQEMETIMRRNIVASFCVLLVTSIAPASAQVVIDLSLITCKQLLDSDAERQILISSWMSGYFSATKNLNELDFRYVKRNAKVVGSYCKTHKSDTVMNAMQKNWR